MVAGCGNKCVKYIFWAINFLFFALGAVIVGLCLWMRFDTSFLQNAVSTAKIDLSRLPLDQFYYILYGIIAVGALLLILGFLGCCGSACESLCVIGLYFFLVIVLFVVEIVAAGLYFFNKDSIRNNLAVLIRTELVGKYNQDVYRTVMDSLQSGLQCCGSTACSDYSSAMMGIPTSCPSNCQYNPPGCATKLWALFEGHLQIVIIVAGAILVVELFAMIFSCIICGAVKEKRTETY